MDGRVGLAAVSLTFFGMPTELLSQPAFSDFDYLCAADQAAVIAFERQSSRWLSARSEPPKGNKWVLRPIRREEWDLDRGAIWVVTKFGENAVTFYCHDWLSYTMHEISCADVSGLGSFIFGKDMLRYEIIYRGEYVNPNPAREGEDTPYIEIGTCQLLPRTPE
jgi:hypothetical protein